MRVRSIPMLAAVALASLTFGCGGSVFTGAQSGGDSGTHDSGPGPSDGGGLDGSSGPDGFGDDSSAPWSPVCPETLPATGAPCSKENVQCEGGQWTVFEPSFEPCQPQPGPNTAACPTDYASVPQGSACSTDGLSCIYEQGECSCQVPLGGPVQIDGGTGYWGCVPEQGCPFPRARLGSACSGDAMCTYEACSYAQNCQGGVWQAQQEACAGAQ